MYIHFLHWVSLNTHINTISQSPMMSLKSKWHSLQTSLPTFGISGRRRKPEVKVLCRSESHLSLYPRGACYTDTTACFQGVKTNGTLYLRGLYPHGQKEQWSLHQPAPQRGTFRCSATCLISGGFLLFLNRQHWRKGFAWTEEGSPFFRTQDILYFSKFKIRNCQRRLI